MLKQRIVAVVILCLLIIWYGTTVFAAEKESCEPITILRNAAIFTLNPESLWTDAMAYDANG